MPKGSKGKPRNRPLATFDERAREKFLEHYEKTGRVQESADVAGIDRTTVYRTRRDDPEFAKLYESAYERFRDQLETEAFQRAVEGWEEPVYQQGELVGKVLKKSDRMLELMLKGHIPERYRDKAAAEINMAGGVLVVGGDPSPEDWAKRIGGGDGD